MSKRTLALGFGLLVVLISMQALLSAGNLHPVVRGLELVALFVAWVLMQLLCLYRPVYPQDRTALQDWAEAQGYTLIRCSRSLVCERQSIATPSGGGTLYRVLVRAPNGRVRGAWVRLDWRIITAEYPEVVPFRWDDAV